MIDRLIDTFLLFKKVNTMDATQGATLPTLTMPRGTVAMVDRVQVHNDLLGHDPHGLCEPLDRWPADSKLCESFSSHNWNVIPPIQLRRMKRNPTPILIGPLRANWWLELVTKSVASSPIVLFIRKGFRAAAPPLKHYRNES